MQNNKFNRTGSFAPASANPQPTAEAQASTGPKPVPREAGSAPAPACPGDKASSLLGTCSKVCDCPIGTQRWETITGMLSSTSLYTQASTHKPLFFSLEIKFCVMNSQGFPCFAGQRNPGLTFLQQTMEGTWNRGHLQALPPEIPATTWQCIREKLYKAGTSHPAAAIREESWQQLTQPHPCWLGATWAGCYRQRSCGSSELGLQNLPGPWGSVLANSLPWTPWLRLSAHAWDSWELVRACLRDPLTGLRLQCRYMLSPYAPSCASSFDRPLNTHNTFLKGRNNPPLLHSEAKWRKALFKHKCTKGFKVIFLKMAGNNFFLCLRAFSYFFFFYVNTYNNV